MLWKKKKILFNKDFFQDKRKVSLLGLGIFIIFTFSYLFYSQYKIHTLEKTKKINSLELNVLKQAVNVSNQTEKDNRSLLNKLSSRVDRIIRTGDDIDTSTKVAAVTVNQASQVSTPATSNSNTTTSTNAYYSSPTPSAPVGNSLGEVEIYDASSKNINYYSDPTTVSKILGKIQNGQTTYYYKFTAGWYQIKDSMGNLVWIPEKNIRHK